MVGTGVDAMLGSIDGCKLDGGDDGCKLGSGDGKGDGIRDGRGDAVGPGLGDLVGVSVGSRVGSMEPVGRDDGSELGGAVGAKVLVGNGLGASDG